MKKKCLENFFDFLRIDVLISTNLIKSTLVQKNFTEILKLFFQDSKKKQLITENLVNSLLTKDLVKKL